MNDRATEAQRRVRLDHADHPVRTDLSTVAVSGRRLWTANDEFATVERLVRQDDGNHGEHPPHGVDADRFVLDSKRTRRKRHRG